MFRQLKQVESVIKETTADTTLVELRGIVAAVYEGQTNGNARHLKQFYPILCAI